ncbi:hypothetical protein DFH09DRAFT_1025314 [Mycena vulgaris]|nr:hypothetical protein DFH09DRAFT_1025314 [Mycena vulgaris]
MKKILLATGFLVAAVARASNSTELDGDCKVQAWVRAEDLAPNHVSHGELRIKVKPAHCANRIASVTLRLQLDEFGEVKHLRQGAVLPEIHRSHNQTVSLDLYNFFGASANDVVYDYSAYDRAMSDSAFWVVKAEERRAWSTEVVLLEKNLNFSQPMITPFMVASPAVNYPPVVTTYRGTDSSRPIRRHAYSQLGYHYIAVVEFANGTTVDIPAGHTNFVPTSSPPPPIAPFTWNVTFPEDKPCGESQELPSARNRPADMQRCLPEELRSVFVAEITLDEGNVIRRGQMLKGKVTVHATNGSTAMSEIQVTFMTGDNQHWAKNQAISGGDEKFSDFLCHRPRSYETLSIDSHLNIFSEKDDDFTWVYRDAHPSRRSHLTPTKPYFDFELEVPKTAAPDFFSHYSSGEAWLELRLDVLYSRDAAICIDGVNGYIDREADERTTDSATNTEEGLWDSHTPIGQPVQSFNWQRSLALTAQVPIVVLSEISTQPVKHYLQPGLPSPVILASQADRVFPVAHPLIIAEPMANTSARLMQSEGTFDPYQSHFNFWNRTRRLARYQAPDPLDRYMAGNYAGLLWKKKIVAMERGILPVQVAEVVQSESNDQHPLVVAP